MKVKKILVLGPVLALSLLWIGTIAVNEAIVTANEAIVADGEAIVNELFTDILTPTKTLARVLDARKSQDQQDPTIVKSRYVFVNFDNLAGKRLPKGAKDIFLNLFPNVSFTAVKDSLERRSSTQYTWFGQIEGAKHSKVILVVNDQSMAGNIRFDGEFYQVRVVKGGVHAIYEIDQSAFPRDAPAIPVKMPELTSLSLPMDESNGCTTIDVMVVYSDDVADAVADIDALIQLAIDETNDSYANSNVNQRVRLVHSAEIDYVETGNSSTDLGRLQNPADGFLDDVHTWRNTFGADCVSFWVESMGACGRGYQMETVGPGFAAYAFSVVDRECATGYFSFGHELGHNMGARHDCYVDTGDKPYSYSHGYVNTDDQWRTIMAYDDECDDSGFDCTRIQYWSNPDVTYGGDPMGEEDGGCDSNNAKSLNNTASTVAVFRATQVSSEPVSDANGPYTAQCQGVTTTLLLDGTGSSLSDPCDTLTFSWSTTCPGGSFDDSSSPTPALTVDTFPGCSVICDVTLTVSNGDGDSDEDTASVTILDEEAPTITCPSDVTIECDESTDPANTGNATATDVCDPSPVITFSDAITPGACPEEFTITRTWTATDVCGNQSSCTQNIEVVDTTPPVIQNVSADPNDLWPPNHKMVPVTVTAIATDNCDSSPVCAISSVSSNEPVNSTGDGNTSPDWVITGGLTVDLRAERSGPGDGRIYTITVTCTDSCDNSSLDTTSVTVQHNQ